MQIEIKNIFENSTLSEDEVFENIHSNDKCRIERIISRGQTTPAGEWYDQDWDEWVILLSGSAILLFQEGSQKITLKPGDYLLIPAHKKHRVEWTDPNKENIWMAVHF